MPTSTGDASSLYQKQIAEFQSKYGVKRQLVRRLWDQQPPTGGLRFEALLTTKWGAWSEDSRRAVLRDVMTATVQMAQQMMPDDADKRKVEIIITTCLADIIKDSEAAVSKDFREPGGVLDMCTTILEGQENSSAVYPEAHIEAFLSSLDFDVFNELHKDPQKHRVMMKEFRSMYSVEWLLALLERFQ